MNYLTEEKLGLFLNEFFPNDFIHNKCVNKSLNKRFKPDYCSEKMKIIIEFDGYLHYNNSKQIKRDFKKDLEYLNLGYKIIRIPYFIQLSDNLIKIIFNKKISFLQNYKNGFIDSKALLPADYCELGILRFKNNLEQFNYCKNEIIESLNNKINELKDIDLVLPQSLRYLINKKD